jgi:hypothetical protein
VRAPLASDAANFREQAICCSAISIMIPREKAAAVKFDLSNTTSSYYTCVLRNQTFLHFDV